MYLVVEVCGDDRGKTESGKADEIRARDYGGALAAGPGVDTRGPGRTAGKTPAGIYHRPDYRPQARGQGRRTTGQEDRKRFRIRAGCDARRGSPAPDNRIARDAWRL